MHLKQNTDYSLRILMYVARKRDEIVSAREISEAYSISYSHTVKIVNKLGKLGYLTLKRGRYGGGIKLAVEPAAINLATVVKQFETNFNIVECFDPMTNACNIAGVCTLQHVFEKATTAFLDSLAESTLADILPPSKK
jgi:Rrf2 family nitric oxide-sensitive transcriptional repressor